jgi:hypothetical protein
MKQEKDLEMNEEKPIVHQPSFFISGVAVVTYVALFSCKSKIF